MTVTSGSISRGPSVVTKTTVIVNQDTGKPVGPPVTAKSLSHVTKLGSAFDPPASVVGVVEPNAVPETPETFSCDACGYVAKSAAGLGAHRRSHR